MLVAVVAVAVVALRLVLLEEDLWDLVLCSTAEVLYYDQSVPVALPLLVSSQFFSCICGILFLNGQKILSSVLLLFMPSSHVALFCLVF